MVFGWMSMGSPSGLRSFDPVRIADLEYRMWVAYYLRRWRNLLVASVRLLWLGFGTDLARILPGAWLMLRAVQLWAPFPDNDPDGAQARMRELYGLVRLRFGQPADPARAASLEIDWWRAHRRRQYASHPAETGDELAESVTRLYCYLFGETEAVVRPAALHRVRAMDLSDQWVREGCRPDSPLLPLERAALVRAYAALLAAVHHGFIAIRIALGTFTRPEAPVWQTDGAEKRNVRNRSAPTSSASTSLAWSLSMTASALAGSPGGPLLALALGQIYEISALQVGEAASGHNQLSDIPGRLP